MNDFVPPTLWRILHETPGLERSYLVGGCVRDWILGNSVTDFDVEVFGIGFDTLSQALERWGRVDLVGRAFGVIKLSAPDGRTYDFALPRRDSKVGAGHKGFQVECEPDLPLREAAARRDFTFNALVYDPRSGEVIDFFGGRTDLEHKRLRHVGPAFVDDPLRVLRGMQFAGRFGLVLDPETAALCVAMVGSYPELAIERVREEWLKWAAKSDHPAAGLRCLRDSGWVVHYPELAALIGVEQDAEWHPEGDVWTHTGHCLDALVALPQWSWTPTSERWVLMFAVLLHDVGKPLTTSRQIKEGRLRVVSPGHERAGVDLARQFLGRLDLMEAVSARVYPLIANHMVASADPTPRALRRLANRLQPSTIENLAAVMTADASGRPPLPRRVPEYVGILLGQAKVMDLAGQPPRPILLGRHLIAKGCPPGPSMGEILRQAFEAQLDGEFDDLPGALAWLERQGSCLCPSP
ncbi:MAG TPA: HD domain-containing protein [Candidatus Limnocylindria bacterium]|nr:HD domain-containing protein [Candidatus Limnocylindria bacterium]